MSPDGWELASRVLDGLAERLRGFVACPPLLPECASDRRAILLLGGPPCLEALDQAHKCEGTRLRRCAGMTPEVPLRVAGRLVDGDRLAVRDR